MEWQEQGLILGTRSHGETSAILELMTANRGRHLGLVRGARSRRMRPVLQPGNTVEVTWRARLDEHLGHYLVEPVELRAANLMQSRLGLMLIQTLCSHLRLLPERDPHASLLEATMIILNSANTPVITANLFVRFELALLEDLGFGLDLARCVVTGETKNLCWVSPKSGCAVCADAGEKWADKLLKLPRFLLPAEVRDAPASATNEEILDGLKLTGYFLNRNIYGPRANPAPHEREGLIREFTGA